MFGNNACINTDTSGDDEERFYKFPRTTHIVNLGAATRDDLIMDSNAASILLGSSNLTIGTVY